MYDSKNYQPPDLSITAMYVSIPEASVGEQYWLTEDEMSR